MREAFVQRKTSETDITLCLKPDGTGKAEIDTGCGFLNHMLTLFAAHGRMDLTVKCVGDTDVDDHHTTEDIGIALGQALKTALGDKRGIARYGSMLLPMDEALVLCAVDLSGRAFLGFDLNLPAVKVGTFDTELVKEFFWGFVRASECTLHLRQLAGENTHHIIEGAFKAFGRAMASAVRVEPGRDEIPSTKGML